MNKTDYGASSQADWRIYILFPCCGKDGHSKGCTVWRHASPDDTMPTASLAGSDELDEEFSEDMEVNKEGEDEEEGGGKAVMRD